MKPFSQYIAEFQKEYKFTLKLAVPDVTDAHLDAIEAVLERYDVKYASKFRRTPIQESPLDFPAIKNMPVHIADIVLSYPSTPSHLGNMISQALGISQQNVVVYSENDPRHESTDIFVRSRDKEGNYKPVIGNLEEDTEKQPYGDSYNMDFLKSLTGTEVHVKKVDSPMNGPDGKADVPAGYNDIPTVTDGQTGLFGRIKKKD